MWEFWIDVGGTFTDCVAIEPDGPARRCKTLSSGRVPGRLAATADPHVVVDARRASDPDRLWSGYTLTVLAPDGTPGEAYRVTAFRQGEFHLDRPLDEHADDGGVAYELSSGELAPIVAVRRVLGLPLDKPLPPIKMRLGTTRGTNALLTRTGARTALVTTAGFEDLYLIGEQDRPDLFALDIRKRLPLSGTAIGVRHRVAADGKVLEPLDISDARRQLARLRTEGWESLAICLLHAHVLADHERQLGRLAAELGFREVSLSSDVYPLMGLVARLDTTLLDAYLNPVLREYLAEIESKLGPGSELRMMTSSGGLKLAAGFRGADSILSGPAGGVAGVAHVARQLRCEPVIGLDMGGTSTDVSYYDGGLDLVYDQVKAGVRVAAPMLAIETVAAGGGSVCWFDGVKLAVGPRSAGADPGPACYGRGGPLTISDVNLHLGRLPTASFPFPLDREAVERRLDECRAELRRAGHELTRDELAEGFFRIANINMVQAIRNVSTTKGRDPRAAVLVGFGGAAGQHVCALARELGMRRVVLHPDAGILSALGIGLADITRHAARGIYASWDQWSAADIESEFHKLEREVRDGLSSEGIGAAEVVIERMVELRYIGQDATLMVEAGQLDLERQSKAFAEAYRRLYGYDEPGGRLELVALRVSGRAELRQESRLAGYGPVGDAADASVERGDAGRASRGAKLEGQHALISGGRTWQVRHWDRAALMSGATITGPAVILESLATTVVDPGWRATVLAGGELELTAEESSDGIANTDANADERMDCDPVLLEVFNQHFASIAERMGLTLRRTARSVNVKQRLDFSCALFTRLGHLVVNAPHIPVHLGAMGETVRCVLEDHPDLQPGDVVVTNDPYRGGSHLPDVTVVTPIHDPATGELMFFTASRAHHAEIGGVTPGSMPPNSVTLADEGVVISSFKLIDSGRARWDALERLLRSGKYPSRNVEDNLADLRAALAANHQGARDLLAMVARHGWPLVEAYMGYIQRAAATKARQAIARLPAGTHEFVDHLDHGARIVVRIVVESDRIVCDFSGTDPVQPNNLNANRAIVMAAVMYAMRCLIDEPIPLNQGVLEPVEVILPRCLLNPEAGATPEESPAVAAGNVETSQRVVDVLLGALGLAAASQGTMNNVLFGDERFGYYETVCGGAGATARCDGADAVHTHMTNTRLTDPEVLESRYPVRLRRFGIRRGSGGAGAHRGGDGVVREIEFLRPLDLSLVTQRRGPYPPYGLAGGGPGSLGRNLLLRAGDLDGSAAPIELPGQVSLSVNAGDRLILETPGGGAYGASRGDTP